MNLQQPRFHRCHIPALNPEWNYAPEADGNGGIVDLKFTEKNVGDLPFSPEGAPVFATVSAKRVPDWGIANNACEPVPENLNTESVNETISLIPYVCTNLRVTKFPLKK